VKARLNRLSKLTRTDPNSLGEQWTREACRHLSDQELKLLQQALRRGFDPASAPGHQTVIVTGEEWAAYRTFQRHYGKLNEGSTSDD
jgi:hypothetical protein